MPKTVKSKAAKAKKAKSLNQAGINKLEKTMLENYKFYDQRIYGMVNECGTFMCAAGFAYLLKVGKRQFNKDVKKLDFGDRCLNAGKKLLGINDDNYARIPDIFMTPGMWPQDLSERYHKLRSPLGRVRLYFKILRTRTEANGTIREKES